jgi:Fe-S cluster assembly protein SufD
MIANTPDTERYAAWFERLGGERAGEPDWLQTLRRDAMERFQSLGFPTTFDEEWKYTNVSPIRDTAFAPARYNPGAVAPPSAVPDAARLVFINGRFSEEHSSVEGLPAGVVAASLAESLRHHPEGLSGHLGAHIRYEDRAFVAQNTALFVDGAHIFVPRGVVVETPIEVVFVSDSAEPAAAFIRNLFVVEENAQATVVETYVGSEGAVAFNNVVTEVVVAENGVLDHVKVQTESEAAYHVAAQHLQQERNSNFTSQSISLGGLLVRNDIHNVLGGEGIESTINGLYVVNGRQHVDNHTAIDHANPHCNSHELYKGVMDGRSTGVFNGKIFVRQDAQKTDAKQSNHNLLLSREASVDTKPQLEIFADDVRCTHGCTIGQLDEEALFYLRARGIGKEAARNLLIHAFASDVLEHIRIAPLREELERRLYAKLPAG